VLDQPIEGEPSVPGPVPLEKVGQLQAVLPPLAAAVTGPGRSLPVLFKGSCRALGTEAASS
jgi:hypothetical protein